MQYDLYASPMNVFWGTFKAKILALYAYHATCCFISDKFSIILLSLYQIMPFSKQDRYIQSEIKN